MYEAMHAARVAAAHDALLALLIESQGETSDIDAIHVSVELAAGEGPTLDIQYSRHGLPVWGEGA